LGFSFQWCQDARALEALVVPTDLSTDSIPMRSRRRVRGEG